MRAPLRVNLRSFDRCQPKWGTTCRSGFTNKHDQRFWLLLPPNHDNDIITWLPKLAYRHQLIFTICCAYQIESIHGGLFLAIMDLFNKLKGKYNHAKSKAEQLQQHPILNTPQGPTSTISIAPKITQDPTPPTTTNQILYQAFEWYTPSDPRSPTENYWHILRTRLPYLASLGITEIHLPPGCKAGNPHGNGYDIYDLWDLGEFDWKDQRPTKWGSKEELVELCTEARRCGIGVVWDAVLNHRCAADHAEKVMAVRVDAMNRNWEVGEPKEIVAWTGFNFPAREGRYSGLKLEKRHFNAIDWDDERKERGIFRFCEGEGCGWAEDVDLELGNSDYL